MILITWKNRRNNAKKPTMEHDAKEKIKLNPIESMYTYVRTGYASHPEVDLFWCICVMFGFCAKTAANRK